jgi:trehalose/maltose hydrolase-like predicted phosphorylase
VRGLHGEAYRGHVFWDEVFVFPFLNLRMPEITRALLLYRYRRLDEARAAARAAGYGDAMFPWQRGSNGREETDTQFFNPRSRRWMADHSHLQRYVGTAVAPSGTPSAGGCGSSSTATASSASSRATRR